MSLFSKDGKCMHDKPYIECGECRAAAVRAGYDYAQSPEGKAEEEEHLKLIRLGRCIERAVGGADDALAHVRSGAKASPAFTIALEDVVERLRKLEQQAQRESMNMLSFQIDGQVRRSMGQ
jgi:hypothetical protein